MTNSNPDALAPLRQHLADGSLAGTWTLDQARSSVKLRTQAMWGAVPVKGTFTDLAGSGEVSSDGQITGNLKIASTSLNTKMKKRDEHLRSNDFFASDKFPTITFQIETVTVTETHASLSGTLTVRDRTLPITFPATVTQFPDGAAVIDAELSIDRADYGLTYRSRGATKMDNTITIRATFTRT